MCLQKFVFVEAEIPPNSLMDSQQVNAMKVKVVEKPWDLKAPREILEAK